MAEGKKSFVLYADYKHTFELLTDEQAGKLMKHLLRYVSDENPEFTEDEILLKIAFEPIKRQLKRDLVDWEDSRLRRAEAGHIGGLKSAESRRKKQIEANEAMLEKSKQTKQNQANQAVNVNGNVTVNVNDTINTNNNFENWDSIKLRLKTDWRLIDKVAMDGGFDRLTLLKRMDEFLADVELKEDYKDFPGLKKHFINWHKKHHNGSTFNRGATAASGKPTKLGTSDARIDTARKW